MLGNIYPNVYGQRLFVQYNIVMNIPTLNCVGIPL